MLQCAAVTLPPTRWLHAEYSSSADYGPLSPRHPTAPNQQIPMVHQGRMWLLIPHSPDRQGLPVGVAGAMFTRAGRELLTIVDIEEMAPFTEQLHQHFKSLGYSMVTHEGIGG